ncbi:hypothetical protein TVAG_099780 [Trichomonas vaginalis G3]|uniref:Uncharacterized protein n=1 Tax=Trichomonas vaginalis (strain ATCC PRA-98 / G3) TaxID=412133 RepID=A2EK45_TRIV3|nr:hypothetical protein TVAGG3_0838150 [Trichomonas vaginalis G3]EAY06938.1 hypothetical protein TVAG_099780 [Trichomonas vaginalis G3]KAI5499089.1 hypothetical protein TVAGG3_0838150 [Trichomonas vaginalis G3]|eukprot:XP_001319161.1 hypothetical protein [Trichomonas vaginalis G3]
MKNSNVLISIYNNLSSSVIFSNSVQDIDGEYLEDIIYSKTKLIILPESLDSSFNNEFFRNWWEQSNFYGIRYETSFCKEGYKSISFWDFGEDRPLAVKATSIEAPIIYREDPFDDIEISLPKLFANNFYNYAEEEFYLQAIKGECSIIEENITYNETNESSCDVNDNSFSLNGETVYKQSGKYKAELAALIIFIILCVTAISVIIYYQILLHKSTENVDNHD